MVFQRLWLALSLLGVGLLLLSSCSGQQNIGAVENSNADGKVELYATSWCPYCHEAKAYLEANGVAYVEYDVELDEAAQQRHQQLLGDYRQEGRVGVPLLVVGENVYLGFDEQTMESALQALSLVD